MALVFDILSYIAVSKLLIPISCCFLISYYLLVIVKKPVIVSANGDLRTFILKHITTLKNPFYPTPWALNCHMQTVIRAILKRSLKLHFKSDIVKTADGINVGIDWLIDDDEDDNLDKPIVLLLPGIKGDGGKQYLCEAKRMGFRTAIYIMQGKEGLPLTEPFKLPRPGDPTELEFILDYIRSKYPKALIIAIGISLGGMALCNYLAKDDNRKKQLFAAFAISTPYNMDITKISMETWFNKNMYNVYLAEVMINFIKRHEELFLQTEAQLPFKLEEAYNCTTFSEFDECVMVPLFGYKSLNAYYKEISPGWKIDKITTPITFVNAVDDPFSPSSGIPIEKFAKSSNALLILTQYGGHVGFIEGLWPTGATYADNVCFEFLKAIQIHFNELSR